MKAFVGKTAEIKMSLQREFVGLNAKFIPKCGYMCLSNCVTQCYTSKV